MSVRILLEIQVQPLHLVVVPHEKASYRKQGCDQDDHAYHVCCRLLIPRIVHCVLMQLWIQKLVLARHFNFIVGDSQCQPNHRQDSRDEIEVSPLVEHLVILFLSAKLLFFSDVLTMTSRLLHLVIHHRFSQCVVLLEFRLFSQLRNLVTQVSFYELRI